MISIQTFLFLRVSCLVIFLSFRYRNQQQNADECQNKEDTHSCDYIVFLQHIIQRKTAIQASARIPGVLYYKGVFNYRLCCSQARRFPSRLHHVRQDQPYEQCASIPNEDQRESIDNTTGVYARLFARVSRVAKILLNLYTLKTETFTGKTMYQPTLLYL